MVARNAGSQTYDGIELGGERITQEIEDELERLARNGQTIRKISIIGYSLGGLISRYAIGLMYYKGWFDKIEPVVRVHPYAVEAMAYMQAELHHLCHAAPGRTHPSPWRLEPLVECSRRQDAVRLWQAAVHH